MFYLLTCICIQFNKCCCKSKQQNNTKQTTSNSDLERKSVKIQLIHIKNSCPTTYKYCEWKFQYLCPMKAFRTRTTVLGTSEVTHK